MKLQFPDSMCKRSTSADAQRWGMGWRRPNEMWSEQVQSEVHATHNWLSEQKHTPAPKNYFSTLPFLKLWTCQITGALLCPCFKIAQEQLSRPERSTLGQMHRQMPSTKAEILELNVLIGKVAPRPLLYHRFGSKWM